VLARQEVVQAGHHAVPVEKEVEGHHRDDDDQQEEVQDAQARAQHGVDELARAGLDGRADLAQLRAQRAAFVEERREARRRRVERPLHEVRGAFGQRAGLAHEGRDDEEDGGDRREDGRERDEDHGPHAAQPRALQPVHERVEEVGQDAAHEEGKEHVAQEPQREREDGKGDPPDARLLPDGDGHGPPGGFDSRAFDGPWGAA
jgi:hypothetical protein